nr:immunoglobulin heavy chain junction region [Macaca mulatta]
CARRAFTGRAYNRFDVW